MEIHAHLDEINVANKKVAPLILIPFIENAFKHISSRTDKLNTIEISLGQQDEGLIFRVYNSKDQKQQNSLNTGEGIGLVNVKRRLDLIYPNAHNLNISNTADSFEVTLTLNKWL